MRPILCVVDLSESAVQVLEVAARMALANKTGVAILFPYRLIDKEYRGEISQMKRKLEEEAKVKFELLRKHVPLLERVSYDFQPEIGFAAERTISFVRRNKVDSIVISQRQANLMNEINQSTLQTLITNLKLPFVIVPEEIDVEEVFSN